MPRILPLGAALSLILGLSAPASAEHLEGHFECDRGLFGCLTTYVGPQDADAALQYAKDARSALDAILERNPGVASAHYDPGRGLLVLEQTAGVNAFNAEIADSIAVFRAHRLRVSSVVLKTPGMHQARNSRKVVGDNGGTSRYLALRGIPVEMDIQRGDEGAVQLASKGLSQVHTTVFGDTVWTR